MLFGSGQLRCRIGPACSGRGDTKAGASSLGITLRSDPRLIRSTAALRGRSLAGPGERTESLGFGAHPFLRIFLARTLARLRTARRARDRARRRLLAAFALGGGTTGLYLLYFLLTEPTVAKVVGNHIDYVSPHFYAATVLTLYVLATCGSSLASSYRRVRWFGIATFVSLVAAGALYQTWFISIWCFFAAAISWIVLLHFLEPRSPETTRLPATSR